MILHGIFLLEKDIFLNIDYFFKTVFP